MELKAKDYKIVDLFRLTFQNAPGCALLIAINKILYGFIPSMMVLGTARFVDTALGIFNGKMEKGEIFPSLFFLVGVFAFQYANWSLVSIIYVKITNKLTESFRVAALEKRSKLEYRHIENNDTWDLISRTCKNPAECIVNGYDNILSILEGIIRVTSLIMIIVVQVWWAGILIIVLSIPLFFISAKGGKVTYDAERESYKYERRANYFSQVLSKRETLEERTLFSYTEKLNERWYDKYEEARKIVHHTYIKIFVRMKTSGMALVAISMVILGALLPALGKGSLSVGMFMGLVTAVLDLVQMMSWHMNWLTREFARSKEYLKDLSAFSKLSEQDQANELPEDMSKQASLSIEFRNVSFRYPDTERYILKDCSFILKEKLHYAFVGINGAGKTTITKLLTGMYDCFEGDIFIGGKSIRTYTLPQLKGIFSAVYQDFARYCISVEDNIKLGNLGKNNEQRMKEVLHMIELEERIQRLPNGFQTILGKVKENGVDLSGGEWQRIAIARNLYSNAPISILDEPTAALDPVAESRIYETFGKISKGKSAIFITHRLGAARLADEIIVIDEGRVVQRGNHETLSTQPGIYGEMFESQRGWYQ